LNDLLIQAFILVLYLDVQAHTQAESLDELNQNLKEVIEMLLEDGTAVLEAEFIGIQTIAVA